MGCRRLAIVPSPGRRVHPEGDQYPATEVDPYQYVDHAYPRPETNVEVDFPEKLKSKQTALR
jgi:hypothetical protein